MTLSERKELIMYVNSGYLYNSRIPFRETRLPLRILSAGTYQLHTWPKLPTWRPRGRVDWQLIYISAGAGHFILDGREIILPAGNMVLYQPKQEQRYFFLGENSSQYWFVHFTGNQVRNILKYYKIPLDGYVLHTGISYEYEDLFKNMRDELVDCSSDYEEMLTFLFRELLITMNRRMNEGAPRIAGFTQDEVTHAKDYFREHYNEDINIERYAASRNMSTSWFNKCFRSITGISPMKFILDVRMRNAQILLETTDGTISEIAQIVGYDNPMYFSRVFRKEKGLSPLKYRKAYREKLLKDT